MRFINENIEQTCRRLLSLGVDKGTCMPLVNVDVKKVINYMNNPKGNKIPLPDKIDGEWFNDDKEHRFVFLTPNLATPEEKFITSLTHYDPNKIYHFMTTHYNGEYLSTHLNGYNDIKTRKHSEARKQLYDILVQCFFLVEVDDSNIPEDFEPGEDMDHYKNKTVDKWISLLHSFVDVANEKGINIIKEGIEKPDNKKAFFNSDDVDMYAEVFDEDNFYIKGDILIHTPDLNIDGFFRYHKESEYIVILTYDYKILSAYLYDENDYRVMVDKIKNQKHVSFIIDNMFQFCKEV